MENQNVKIGASLNDFVVEFGSPLDHSTNICKYFDSKSVKGSYLLTVSHDNEVVGINWSFYSDKEKASKTLHNFIPNDAELIKKFDPKQSSTKTGYFDHEWCLYYSPTLSNSETYYFQQHKGYFYTHLYTLDGKYWSISMNMWGEGCPQES